MNHHPDPSHPFSSMLRQRSAHLQEIATRVEHAAVMQLDGAPSELARRLLDRNVQQLHLVTKELRDDAARFRRRADELDRAVVAAS